MNQIQVVIDELKNQYDEKYGYSIFSVNTNYYNNIVRLQGCVLLESQKAKLIKELKSFEAREIDDEILVLSELENGAEIGWGKAISFPVNVFQYPPFCNKQLVLSSQIYKNDDVIRILFEKDVHYLIQLVDLTLGWVETSKIILIENDLPPSWKVMRAGKNQITEISSHLKGKLLDEAMSYLDVDYLWGGLTKNGIDCSGFTQRLYRDVLGIILPKNSKDQRRLGMRSTLDNMDFSDLIFLKAKAKNISHVGIFLGDRIAHASLNLQKVVYESVDEILENYRFVGVRKYVKFI